MTEHANQYGCKMTKLPLVFYKKDIGIDLSFVQETSGDSCLLWLVSQNCIFVGQNLNARIAFILGRRE
jgi:hypothetical protein